LAKGGGKVAKCRKPSGREWTRQKEVAFLSALAETCNVTAAAAAAGVSKGGAYQRRKKVAAFRAGWADAIAIAYQQLELAVLDRSLNGTEKVTIRKDGSEERVRDYPNAVAMTLLKMHRDSATAAVNVPPQDDIEEVRTRIFQKLQRLRKRGAK
jgi:hypothetical protein